jgi:rhodanese-related sulfurtransferase
MTKKRFQRVLVFLMTLLVMSWAVLAAAEEVPRLPADKLKAMMGSPNLVIIDVRTGLDWDNSSRKIAGAVREDPREVKSWAKDYSKNKTLVLYCA